MKFSPMKPDGKSWQRLSRAALPTLAVILAICAGWKWQHEAPTKADHSSTTKTSARPAAKDGVSKSDKTLANLPPIEAVPTAAVAAPALSEPESLWTEFAKARHAVQPLTEREAAMPQNRGVRYFAANPRQELTARFMDGGVRIESGRGGGWQGLLEVTQVKRGAEQVTVPTTGAPTADGARVEYQRGDMVEWYENREAGIEHGFTMAKNPVAGQEGPLQIDMKFAGLKPSAQADGKSVNFQTAEGMPVLSYSDLKVWDARGTSLKAEMTTSGEGMSILVADAGAVYPVTIDPIIATLEQKLGPDVTGSGSPDDHFGSSVAVDGDTALVGMPGDDTAAGNDAGSAFVFVRTGSVWNLQTRLTASDAATNDSFGSAVSLSATTAVVGAPPVMPHPTGALPQQPEGSAYVFVRSGNTWTQQMILTPGAEINFRFGTAVAVAGDTTLVGDSGADKVHVFFRTGTAWARQTVLTPGQGNFGEAFGSAVSIFGNSALIGAPLASGSIAVGTGTVSAISGTMVGAAYVFVRTGTAWSEQDKWFGEDDFDQFGCSTAIFGDRAIVGAPGADTSAGTDAGTAYAFTRSGTVWSEDGMLAPTAGQANSGFGGSVSLGTDRALVGASHVNKAYVFERMAPVINLAFSPWSQKAVLQTGDAKVGDMFGSSVSLSGDTALIGAPFNDSPAGVDAGTAFVFVHGDHLCCDPGLASDDGGWCQQARLSAGDAASRDFFGRPLALDGNTALVGAQGDDTAAGSDAGTVYVFVRTGTTWAQQARLAASDAASGDGFGRALAISGNTALASSPNANGQTGSAYIFVRTGSVWLQAAELTAKDGLPLDSFGRSVSLSGNTAVVSAYGDDTPAGESAGSVYVFTGAASKWAQQAKLMAGDASAFDLFGQSVSMSGETLLVGAMGDDSTASVEERGAAYVFLRVGKTWAQQAKLVPSDVANFDGVGHSVSLFGNTALVSADGADTPAGANAGAAYIFVRTGSTWSQQSKLLASNGAANDGFGRIVALNEGLALIGAPQDDTVGGADAGSAYLFKHDSGAWQQLTQLTAGDGAANDLFGWALALSPNTAMVGADSDDGVDVYGDTVINQGGVYVFRLTDTTPPDIRVEQPADNPLVDAETPEGFGPAAKNGRTVKDLTALPVDFGDVVVGEKPELVFQVLNEGGTALSGIKVNVDGPNKSEFKVVKAPAPTVASRGEINFIVSFSPTATGVRTASLRILSNDPDEAPFDVMVRGTGLPAEAPTISELSPRLVAVGTTVKFDPKVTGRPAPKIVWKRNGATIPKAESATLSVKATLTSTGQTNAGLYVISATNSAGPASRSVELGVVDTTSKTLVLPTGATATMVVRAAGNNLTYTWLKNGALLPLNSRITVSADGKTLTIKNLVIGDANAYSCLVTGPGPEAVFGGRHALIVIDEHPMILEPVVMPDGLIGKGYKFLIPVDSDPIRLPTSFGASGLPSGLTINKDTGLISGVPKVSGLFNVVLTAKNFWGTTPANTTLYISPLPSLGCNAIGTFNGLVNRDGGLNGGFGGSIVLTTIAKGTFTGQLALAGVKYPFSGAMVITGSGSPSAKVSVKRTASSLGPVNLEFSLDEMAGVLNGSITDKAVFPFLISDLAGSPLFANYSDGKGAQAWFNAPQGIARDKAGNLYVADTNNHVIRKVTVAGVVTTIGGMAGFCGSTDGPVAEALFHSPQGLTVDAAGNIYVADTGNQAIRKISVTGVVTTVAGSAGIHGSVNGTGAAARFMCPTGIVLDSTGNLFVSDHEDHTVRKITPAGVVTTFAGKSATPGTANGGAAAARFNAPKSLAIDSADRLLLADTGNHAIRAITKTGAVTTFAGAPGVPGSADGLRANARFYGPSGVAVDAQGNVFVADTLNYTLRRVNSVGIVSTVAGKQGTPGIDGGVDGAARFTLITGVVVNGTSVFVTDAGAHLVRKGVAKPALPVEVLARRNPFGTDPVTTSVSAKTSGARVLTTSCFNPPASSFVGTHNVAFDLPNVLGGNNAYPQGNGFGTVNITSTGIVTWAGLMADGTPTTGSTMLGGSLNTLLKYFPLHFMLYSNTGSAQGWQEIGVNRRLALPGEVETNAVTPNDVLIDGFLDWMKIPQAVYTRSYVDGIPLHVLTSIGERNDPPASGEIILNFPATSNNAVADFYQGGLPGGSNPRFSQGFTITSNNAVVMPGSNPKDVKITIAAPASKFSGNFVLQDTNPIPSGTPPMVTRTPTFSGVFLHRTGRGVGHVLVPELPSAGPPATTPANSQILSGQIVIEPVFATPSSN